MPSVGFSWPMNGLPSWLIRNFSSSTLPGCGYANMPTPPSNLISWLFWPSTSQLESRSQWEKQISWPWHVASWEFDAACKPLSPKLTSPSTTWSVSMPLLTCTPLVTLPSGPLSAWVSSAFSDPGTWFLSLRELGNLVPTSRIAMSVLLSGVPSFHSATPKLASLMALLSRSPSRIPGTPFCPVMALHCLFAVIPVPSSQPLFSFSFSEWITYSDVRVFI
jgi:hypothetical protein